MTSFEIIMAIINTIAVIAIPVVAVLIGQKLQDRSEKRKDKMQIFKVLMTARIYGWTTDSVHALNIIDIVFADDDGVRSAWKDLFDKLNVVDPDAQQSKKIELAQYKLLEAIANALGYKGKITWETIQNPYKPVGLGQQIAAQQQTQQAYLNILSGMSKMMPETKPQTEENNNGGDK